MHPRIDIQRQLPERQGLHVHELVFQGEGVDLQDVGACEVRAAEGVVGGVCCGGGRGEGVPGLGCGVDADDEVFVVEAAEEVGE